MSDEHLRNRLEALNRGPLPADVAEKRPEQSPAAVAISPAAVRSRVTGTQSVKQIPGLLRQGEVIATSAGEHLRIRLPLEAMWPGGTDRVAARQEHLQLLLAEARQAVEPSVVMSAEFAALVAALPDRVLMLDLETCGLAGSALFLVGLLRQIDGAPTVELLVARNYAEEQAILESLWQIVAGHDVLVTFNGKSFDWPMVTDRSARYRLSGTRQSVGLADSTHPTKLLHVDLLHHARRRWKRQLPDCRLQTLEQAICRRSRSGDISGNQIPAAYAEFVRTGFEREMDAILYHNAVDLVTLFDLALRLAA